MQIEWLSRIMPGGRASWEARFAGYALEVRPAPMIAEAVLGLWHASVHAVSAPGLIYAYGSIPGENEAKDFAETILGLMLDAESARRTDLELEARRFS